MTDGIKQVLRDNKSHNQCHGPNTITAINIHKNYSSKCYHMALVSHQITESGMISATERGMCPGTVFEDIN